MSVTYRPNKEVEDDLLLRYFMLDSGKTGRDGLALPADFNTPVCDLPPLAWAEAHRRIEGQPFSLDYRPATADEPATGYEPLREIYDDDIRGDRRLGIPSFHYMDSRFAW